MFLSALSDSYLVSDLKAHLRTLYPSPDIPGADVLDRFLNANRISSSVIGRKGRGVGYVVKGMLTMECMLGNHVLDKRSALDLESEAHDKSFLLRAGMIDLRIPLYHLLSAHKSVVALTVDAYAIACDLLARLIWYLYCLLEVCAQRMLWGDG